MSSFKKSVGELVFGPRKKPQLDLEDYLVKIKKAGLDQAGHELVSSTPMQPPAGYKKQPSLAELVREMVQSEALRRQAEADGAESLEEFEDFDVDDDGELMRSPWENQHDPSLAELAAAGEAELQARQASSATPAEPKAPAPAPQAAQRSSAASPPPAPSGHPDEPTGS